MGEGWREGGKQYLIDSQREFKMYVLCFQMSKVCGDAESSLQGHTAHQEGSTEGAEG